MRHEDELTPELRELERALKTLRPTAARIDPVAAAHAAGRRSARGRLRAWQAAAAVAALAAGGAWLALNSRGPIAPNLELQEPGAEARLAATAPLVKLQTPVEPPTAEQPTLLAYRLALAHSPAALDALLTAHATTAVAHHDAPTPVEVRTFWTTKLPPSLGEM